MLWAQFTWTKILALTNEQTVSAIASCILGLLDRPDVLKKGQQELDSVVKLGHLPDFNDEELLPFITAIVKETMRWRDVAPIGSFHHTYSSLSPNHSFFAQQFHTTWTAKMNTKAIVSLRARL